MTTDNQQPTTNNPRLTSDLRRLTSVFLFLLLISVLCPLTSAFADTHYVDIVSTNPTPPYTNWSTAATVIQDAVDASVNGDTVLVAAGVYSNGGRAVYGTMTNRVAIDRAIVVVGIAGPSNTIVVGGGALGDAAIRCAYLGPQAVLAGVSLVHGRTRDAGDLDRERRGGGVWCEADAVMSNCWVSLCEASWDGGGIYGGTVRQCVVTGNRAWTGGGVFYSRAENSFIADNTANWSGGGAYGGSLWGCTVAGNTAFNDGGGIASCAAFNSIIYHNSARQADNWAGSSTFTNCCTWPMPSGEHNTTGDPGLPGLTNPHLVWASPCRDAGSLALSVGAFDIDGEARVGGFGVEMGCDEVWPRPSSEDMCPIIVGDTQVVAGSQVRYVAQIAGCPTQYVWQIDDRVITNQTVVTHVWRSTGTGIVVLTAWDAEAVGGVTCRVDVFAVFTNYASPAGGHSFPFTRWEDAATNLQDAIDATPVGGFTLVAPGVYDRGGRVVCGMPCRMAMEKATTVMAVDDAFGATVIAGSGPNGPDAVRCAYVGEGACLVGFTLTNGHTKLTGDEFRERSGGGVWSEQGIVVNCHVADNEASQYGGGCYGGGLQNCKVFGNASFAGGGCADGPMRGCLVWDNRANLAGGAYFSDLMNCTVVGNSATSSWGGGGVWGGDVQNSIVVGNVALTNENHAFSAFSYSCSIPLPEGTSNTAQDPRFRDPAEGGFDILPASPCVDRGANQEWMVAEVDLDGNPRILNGTVDMGAYEFHFDGDLRALLQGPYEAGSNRLLRALETNLLLRSPYVADARSVSVMPSDAVDWALVEVRGAPTNTSVSASAAFLRSDGVLVDADGNTNVLLEVSPMTTNYLVISHRNHLSAMSVPIAFTNQVISYDFTTGPDKYYGGTNGCVELEPGVWGLIAGDVDGDGAITETDRAIAEAQTNRTGYLPGDVDLDGVVR